MTRDWLATLLRPNSVLTRVRVGEESKMTMIEQQSLPQLTQQCRNLGVDPAQQLVNLFNIFSELTQLSAGQYLLQHSDKTGAFCDVLRDAEGREKIDLDLHKLYAGVKPEELLPARVAFSPIDTDILTPWHQVHGRVPGTFEPRGVKISGGKGRGGRGGGGKGRGRGGKNKRGRGGNA